MKKEQEDLCLVAYDLETTEDGELKEVRKIRKLAGLYSPWPKPVPKVAPPSPRVYNWTKERLKTREFETAIGLGWHVRLKHRFLGWLRKALKAHYDMHDVVQSYTGTIDNEDLKGKGL